MSKLTYKKIFSLHDPKDPLKSKNAGIYLGSDGKMYVSDGISPPICFLSGSTTPTALSESTIYDEDLKAFIIIKD